MKNILPVIDINMIKNNIDFIILSTVTLLIIFITIILVRKEVKDEKNNKTNK